MNRDISATQLSDILQVLNVFYCIYAKRAFFYLHSVTSLFGQCLVCTSRTKCYIVLHGDCTLTARGGHAECNQDLVVVSNRSYPSVDRPHLDAMVVKYVPFDLSDLSRLIRQ